jgi:hypothetical protein
MLLIYEALGGVPYIHFSLPSLRTVPTVKYCARSQVLCPQLLCPQSSTVPAVTVPAVNYCARSQLLCPQSSAVPAVTVPAVTVPTVNGLTNHSLTSQNLFSSTLNYYSKLIHSA